MSSVKVFSSVELDTKAKAKIETSFRKKHGDEVDFIYEVDPSLIGGILVIDGVKYYDASVRGQLAAIKRNLAQ